MTQVYPFRHEESAEHPGWMTWEASEFQTFNVLLGPMLVRHEDAIARVRIVPGPALANYGGAVHGGTTAGFIDCAMFAGAVTLGVRDIVGGVTLDLAIQFVGAGRIGEPLDAEVEVVRETGRLVFLRGLVTQGPERIASFSGALRKGPRQGAA